MLGGEGLEEGEGSGGEGRGRIAVNILQIPA